jgi:serine/threonine-protein kinase
VGAVKRRGAREGDFLAGKYLLEDCLGVGGFGEVYRAQNVSLGRTVAIKLLSKELTQYEDDVLRFLREARAAAAVRHPNVVDILDILRDDEGTPFIVQELLHGQDLEQYMQVRGGRLSVGEVLEVMIPVADAVYAAHARKVVHRDLKPANIFLAREGDKIVPKVLDFGAALYQTVGAVSAKEQRMLIGTPHYMAPEQISTKKDVDVRADVWAMGVILYELLVGETPFEAEGWTAVLRKVRTIDVPPLRDAVPSAPEALEHLVLRCTQREKTRRPKDAAEVRDALAEIKAKRRAEGKSRPKEDSVPEASELRLTPPNDADPASGKLTSLALPQVKSPTKRRGSALLSLSLPDEELPATYPPPNDPPSSTQRRITPRGPEEPAPFDALDPLVAEALPADSGIPTKEPPAEPASETPEVRAVHGEAAIDPLPLVVPPPKRASSDPSAAKPAASTDAEGDVAPPARVQATHVAGAIAPAAVAAMALHFAPAVTRPLAHAMRGESPLASGVFAIATLVIAAGLAPKALATRSRALVVGTLATVALGIVMIVVTFSASETVALGMPPVAAFVVPFIAPIAPAVLGLASLARARASWASDSKHEACFLVALASVLFTVALELSPVGAVLSH